MMSFKETEKRIQYTIRLLKYKILNVSAFFLLSLLSLSY